VAEGTRALGKRNGTKEFLWPLIIKIYHFRVLKTHAFPAADLAKQSTAAQPNK
jgi:hypothetical protein